MAGYSVKVPQKRQWSPGPQTPTPTYLPPPERPLSITSNIMTQFPHSSFSQRRSSTRQTIPPFPSFTLVLLGRSQRLRKAHTCTPVVQSVAGWGMVRVAQCVHLAGFLRCHDLDAFDYHAQPAYGDAHDIESTGILGMLEPKTDDSSEISVLDLGEPAVSTNAIQKVRYMRIKLLLFSRKQSH
ncbi:hypothetical protein BD410DRAFT_4336 [Rickenella mellea]|uniref:Uncharacterized protein n=1 Tax=Rickenella mellea TaxID=50990 RepID=A0A4R5XG37_9AGAM|nr:hypothetical protein BD410DRAFT_4336 [Rickenella mellea]